MILEPGKTYLFETHFARRVDRAMVERVLESMGFSRPVILEDESGEIGAIRYMTSFARGRQNMAALARTARPAGRPRFTVNRGAAAHVVAPVHRPVRTAAHAPAPAAHVNLHSATAQAMQAQAAPAATASPGGGGDGNMPADDGGGGGDAPPSDDGSTANDDGSSATDDQGSQDSGQDDGGDGSDDSGDNPEGQDTPDPNANDDVEGDGGVTRLRFFAVPALRLELKNTPYGTWMMAWPIHVETSPVQSFGPATSFDVQVSHTYDLRLLTKATSANELRTALEAMGFDLLQGPFRIRRYLYRPSMPGELMEWVCQARWTGGTQALDRVVGPVLFEEMVSSYA